MQNTVITRPLDMAKAPYAEITVKLGKAPISEILENITDVIYVPYRIGVDFYASASSPNRPLEMIHPSIGTICNHQRLMTKQKDFDKLLEEFEGGVPVEKMMMAHSASRQLIIDSGLRITQILAMRVYISRYLYKDG